jgi:hypothetical protein
MSTVSGLLTWTISRVRFSLPFILRLLTVQICYFLVLEGYGRACGSRIPWASGNKSGIHLQHRLDNTRGEVIENLKIRLFADHVYRDKILLWLS